MTRVLVTGAQGFIGRNVCAALLEDESCHVMGVGRSSRLTDVFSHSISWPTVDVPAPLPAGLEIKLASSRYQYESADLCDSQRLLELIDSYLPDWVIHLASGLRGDDAERLVQTNVAGTVNLLNAVGESKTNCSRFVVSSSGGVYGDPNDQLPIHESATCRPIDIYSATKFAAEEVSRVLADKYKIPIVWARVFNVLGPGQDQRHVCGRFACQAALIRLGQNEEAVTVQNLDATRDFVDVRDVASAMVTIAKKGISGAYYNVCSGKETQIGTLLDLVLRAANIQSSTEISSVAGRQQDIPRHVGDMTSIGAIGFATRHSLQQSIQDVVDYYLTLISNNSGPSESTSVRAGKKGGNR